ncbi:isochorismate synthase [Phytohabitans sp. ZYX-F-186]|uniref:isochorismate synthase n=1 Tax=Phytohabitans maris TaxID=3071409 RepID=A0ABU0ZB68_9ACTN|nr:isochorismate synthase [Phytohabitans sp. ZYX-F-186]MDQ7903572.1 isochorismate synthase [Phytohabitans sp. ZYX-F-186]
MTAPYAAFATAGRTLAAGPGSRRLPAGRSGDAGWADAVLSTLARSPGVAYAIGALGFRPDAPATALLADPSRSTVEPCGPVRYAWSAPTEVPPRAGYADAVRTAVDRLATDPALSKVVLGRWLELTCAGDPEPAHLLAALAARHPSAYVFGVPLERGAGYLLGASPELLVGRRGRRVRSTPLAGSIPRAADPVEDRIRADLLRDSAKDRHEHALVVDAVAEALGPLCRRLDVPARPALVRTDTMWHLASPVAGELREVGPATSALRLAQLLHPTPAVCGTPRDAAYRLIEELEPADRGPLTGAVGWLDAAGDGDWAVTIRAGLLHGRELRLFAGAGIVPGSDPGAEVAETGAKLATMLAAVGAAAPRPAEAAVVA